MHLKNLKKNIVFGFKTVVADLAKLAKSFMRLIQIIKRQFQNKRKKLKMIIKKIQRTFRKNILFQIILITRLLELQDTVH